MKTTFTYSSFRTLFITFTIAISTLNLTGQTKHMVAVTDFKFTPKELTITAGDTVVWTNTGAMGHNVNGTQTTFPANPESFGNDVGLGWTYVHVFNLAGTYKYHCNPHFSFMTGTVTVNPAPELTVNFTAMTPHIGESFYLAVIDTVTKMEIGRVEQIATVSFSIVVPGIKTGKSYWVDFWADHNKNGVYDAPPADHAWRLPLYEVNGNTTLDFVHNTNFFDISLPTASRVLAGIGSIHLYPNPASQYIELLVPVNYEKISSLKVYSIAGSLIDQKILTGSVESFRYDLNGLKNGVYFMEIISGLHKDVLKFIKQ